MRPEPFIPLVPSRPLHRNGNPHAAPEGPLCELRLEPDRVHPELDWLERGAANWVRTSGLPAAELLDQALPRFAARMYPHVRRETVAFMLRWYLISFALDDQGDYGTTEPGGVLPLYEQIQRRLDSTETPEHDDPLVRVVVAEWRVASEGMSDSWRSRFQRHFSQHGQAHAWERLRKEQRLAPTLTSYADLRNLSTGLWLWDLAEPANGVEIPAVFAESLTWQLYIRSSADLISWRNDVASVTRELSSGDMQNSVIIHTLTDGLSVAQALQLVEDKITARCAEFLQYEDAVFSLAESLPDEYRVPILTIAKCVRTSLAGHVHSLRESSRYDLDGAMALLVDAGP